MSELCSPVSIYLYQRLLTVKQMLRIYQKIPMQSRLNVLTKRVHFLSVFVCHLSVY